MKMTVYQIVAMIIQTVNNLIIMMKIIIKIIKNNIINHQNQKLLIKIVIIKENIKILMLDYLK